jgi:hypothetical protein
MKDVSLSPAKQKQLLEMIRCFTYAEASFVLKHLTLRTRAGHNRTTHVLDLAKETMSQVFSYIHDARTLATCSEVCRVWHHIMLDNFMWKEICRRKSYQPLHKVSYDRKPSKIPRPVSLAPWKDVYQRNYLTWRNWMVGKYKLQKLNKFYHTGLCMDFTDTLAYTVARGQPGQLWELSTGRCTTLIDHEGITAIKFDDRFIVAGYRDGMIRLWDIQKGQWRLQFQAHTNTEIGSILIHKDYIVSGSEDHLIRVWDIRTGERKHELRGHEGAICALTLQHDTLVSGSTDSTIKIWNLCANECIRTLHGHEGAVFAVQFNSKYVCSGANDASVKVWSFESGTLLRTLKGHHRAVVSLQFDDNKIVTGSADNTLKVSLFD